MIFVSALCTFLPFGGDNYAHQVSDDNDKTWAHFKMLHQMLILVSCKTVYFMLDCSIKKGIYTQCRRALSSLDWSYNGNLKCYWGEKCDPAGKGRQDTEKEKWNSVWMINKWAWVTLNQNRSHLSFNFCSYFLVLQPILSTVFSKLLFFEMNKGNLT